MNRQDRLAEIEEDLNRNSMHKKIMLLLVITLGISTAFELYEGSYWAVLCDVLCVIFSAINVSLTEKEDRVKRWLAMLFGLKLLGFTGVLPYFWQCVLLCV